MFDIPCFTCAGTGEVSAEQLPAEAEDGQNDDAEDEDDSLEAYLADVYADEIIASQDRLTAIFL